MTNNEVINKALQELGIVAAGESATSQDAADMLDILNGMMAEWEERDLNFNWFPQNTLSDNCPIPRWAEQAIISNLAVTSAPTMRAPIPDALAVKASDGYMSVATTIINKNMKPADMGNLPVGEGNYRYNINSDAF